MREAVVAFVVAFLMVGKVGAQPLEVKSWRCEKEYGYVFVHGEVRNVSGGRLEHVVAIGTFRTMEPRP